LQLSISGGHPFFLLFLSATEKTSNQAKTKIALPYFSKMPLQKTPMERALHKDHFGGILIFNG